MTASRTCPRCHAVLNGGAKFCSECGAALPVLSRQSTMNDGERRQATILFADITGYTRLSSEMDPEELHALLGRYFESVDGIIRDFGGTVDKHIGDAVMGVFGAPVSHGNDPERAVRAALAIHAAMQALSADLGRALSVHVGIASGQVVAAPTGSQVHREYTVLGDAVNLASRLDGLAGAGETAISASVYHAVAALVDADAGGEVDVKGISAPVRVYRVRGLHDHAAAERPPIVGRLGEIETFKKLLAATQAEGRGRVLFVRGEPGIGKTRLVEELRSEAERRGFMCHRGLVLDFGMARGQDALRALVRSALTLPLEATPPERERAVADALDEGLFSEDEHASANDLLDLPQPIALRALYDAMTDEMRSEARRRTAAGLLSRVSRKAPVLAVVEDVHWADARTLGALAAIAAVTAEAPIVLTITSRVDGDPITPTWRAQAGAADIVFLPLGPLEPEATEALAGMIAATASDRVHSCVVRSGGNPLFLEQLLRSDAEGALPDTVQSLVQARMDRLDPHDKRALQAASVIGQRFSLELLRHLIDDPVYRCELLTARGLVRPEGDSWLFAHALVRDGAYSSLLRQARRDLHRRAATWFGSSDLVLRAEHLDRAEDEDAALSYLAAAASLVDTFEYERAFELLKRAGNLARTNAEKHAIALQQGELLLYRADEGAVAAFERALAAATTDAERCRAFIGLADCHRTLDALDAAHTALDHALQCVTPNGMHAELSRIHRIRGSLKFVSGYESRDEQDKALDHALRARNVELEARALSCMGDAHYMAGRIRTAHEYFTRCVELCRRHGLGRVELYQYYMLGMMRYLLGDMRGAIAAIEHGIDFAIRSGHRRAEVIARETMALVLIEAARYDDAVRETEVALALADSVRSSAFAAILCSQAAEALFLSGRHVEAREALARSLKLRGAHPSHFGYLMIAGTHGLFAESEPELTGILDDGERVAKSRASPLFTFFFHVKAIEACLKIGAWSRAERHARESLHNWTEPPPLASFHAERVAALTEVARGQNDGTTRERLELLLTEAERFGFSRAKVRIEQALTEMN